MELTFVHQYAGESPKRRRLAKACETCRARKKRCIHFAGAEGPRTARSVRDGSESLNNPSETTKSNALDYPSAESTATPSSGGHGAFSDRSRSSATHKRFFSDLNPESTFLSRTVPARERTWREPNEDIGVWVDKNEYDALVRQKNNPTSRSNPCTVLHGMHPHQIPHSTVLAPLIDLYFKKIHPILPLLDEADFRGQYADGQVPETLIHAMCLVAAKDAEAGPHLHFGSAPSTLLLREFCARLSASVTGGLQAPSRYDRIALIQILALASLHMEGADGAEEASMLLVQAMHHAQTLGIHLGQHSSSPGGPESLSKRIFWCLWALDRLNSVMNGRPIIMNDIDIAIEPYAVGESGFPAFEAWLKVTELLNKIISFYRPHNPSDMTGWEDDYPGMEEIIDEAQAWQQPQSALSTIHLFFLTTAILSHRSRGIKQIPRGTHSHIRQRLCAIEIVRLLESEHGKEIHALPFIPYAVSLALSVSYQHLRQSQLHHQQEDARSEFRRCTRLLQSLRRTWSSADTMTALAMKVLEGLDKAPSLSSFRIPRTAGTGATHDEPGVEALTGLRSSLLDAVSASEDNAEHNTATPTAQQDSLDLFDGMDDIFGMYLDPNYPVNLDDMSFVDNLPPLDWNQMQPQPAPPRSHYQCASPKEEQTKFPLLMQ